MTEDRPGYRGNASVCSTPPALWTPRTNLAPIGNNARRKHAVRYGGGKQRVYLDELDIAANAREDEMLAVDGALEKLL